MFVSLSQEIVQINWDQYVGLILHFVLLQYRMWLTLLALLPTYIAYLFNFNYFVTMTLYFYYCWPMAYFRNYMYLSDLNNLLMTGTMSGKTLQVQQ